MGYALYGHELNDEMSPLESVAAWAIKMDKEFIGKSALKEPQKRVVPLIIEKGIARQGDHLFQKNRDIGIVTSGNFSPSLKRGIALGLVAKEVTGPIEVEIRGRKIATKEVNLPFYRR
jgi:aminomethyltransferase